MAGYRDRVFCPYYEKCKDGATCPRALTPEVKEGAKRWWGLAKGSPHIEQYAALPLCFIEPAQSDLFT